MTIGGTNLDELLDAAMLPLPSSPRVLEIRHEPFTDWTGDEAIRVWVVLPDGTPESQRAWARIAPIDRAIRDALSTAGITLFPYIAFRTRSEMREELKRRNAWRRGA